MGHVQQQAVIGDLLKTFRKRVGLKQAEVASRLGVPQSFVSKYESGERKLDLVEAQRVCVALEISLTELVAVLEQRAGALR